MDRKRMIRIAILAVIVPLILYGCGSGGGEASFGPDTYSDYYSQAPGFSDMEPIVTAYYNNLDKACRDQDAEAVIKLAEQDISDQVTRIVNEAFGMDGLEDETLTVFMEMDIQVQAQYQNMTRLIDEIIETETHVAGAGMAAAATAELTQDVWDILSSDVERAQNFFQTSPDL